MSLYGMTVGKDMKFRDVLAAAGVDEKMAEAVIDRPELAEGLVKWLREQLDQPIERFAHYTHLLLSLEDQLALLRQYNQQFWGGRLTDEQLAAVDTTTTHVQRVEDFEFFYVSTGTLHGDLDLHWNTLKGTQPGYYHSGFKTGKKDLQWDPTAREYKVGIHRIRVNLVANWDPQNGRTVDQVRANAVQTGEQLAAVEAMAAYGFLSALFREQNGVDLPYCDMAGLQQRGNGDWRLVPYFSWGRIARKAFLRVDHAVYRYSHCAAPSLVRE